MSRGSARFKSDTETGFANVEAAFERHQALALQMLDSRNDAQYERYAARMALISNWWEPRFPAEWQDLSSRAEH